MSVPHFQRLLCRWWPRHFGGWSSVACHWQILNIVQIIKLLKIDKYWIFNFVAKPFVLKEESNIFFKRTFLRAKNSFYLKELPNHKFLHPWTRDPTKNVTDKPSSVPTVTNSRKQQKICMSSKIHTFRKWENIYSWRGKQTRVIKLQFFFSKKNL